MGATARIYNGLAFRIEAWRNDGECPVKALLLMIGATVLLATTAADARDWRSGFGPLVQTQGHPMKKGQGRFLRDPNKQGGQDKGNQGRLTQEERQELHRDLDRANREIYRR